MRGDCNKSMSFIVVSSTDCPDVGNAAIEDCREEIVCSRCWSVLTVVSAWCEESILILALAGFWETGIDRGELWGEEDDSCHLVLLDRRPRGLYKMKIAVLQHHLVSFPTAEWAAPLSSSGTSEWWGP